MRIQEETTHLIIITIKSYTHQNETIVIIMDLFNFNIICIKLLNTIDNTEINKTIINFYNLYIKNYEFLTDLQKDLTCTSVLFLNFKIPNFNSYINSQDWWNERKN